MSELNHLFETDSITVSDREEVFDRTIKDYERVLPSSNQVRWYGKNKFWEHLWTHINRYSNN